MDIIDRRPNSGGKNLSNRQRFLKRVKKQVKDHIEKDILKRSITSEKGEDVSVPKKGISEPSFRNNPHTGKTDRVLPGNREYSNGDLIEKPKGGGGGGGKGDASDSGEGEDDFIFSITGEEYDQILFEDCELPELKKKSQKNTESFKTVRAGYANDGNPSNLDLEKTMKNSLGRRIALKNPKLAKIQELKKELEELESKKKKSKKDLARIEEIKEEILILKQRASRIAYIDDNDLRYKKFVKHPNPKHQAVMFCVMDVSASMGQSEKELAKRFYMLLYRFLKLKYKKVDIVYIRHHTIGIECNEEEFFYSKETGGTLVSSGFQVMNDIIKSRYPEQDWNIYCAQASDGDNFRSDNDKLLELLHKSILPVVQFMYYIEVGESIFHKNYSELWDTYARSVQPSANNFTMKEVAEASQILPVFKELFKKKSK